MFPATVVVAVVLAVAFTASGASKLANTPRTVDMADHLHIPRDRYRLIGVPELAGGAGVLIGLWVVPLGVAAGSGLVILLGGAVATHLRANDTLNDAAPAAVWALVSARLRGAPQPPPRDGPPAPSDDIEAWVRHHYTHGADSLDVDGFMSGLSRDVVLTTGGRNRHRLRRRAAPTLTQLFSLLTSLTHHIHRVAAPDHQHVVVDASVTYRFRNGNELTLPATTTFRFDGHQARSIQLDIDTHAIAAAAIGEPIEEGPRPTMTDNTDPAATDFPSPYRVGLLVPSSNTTMETEVPAICAPTASSPGTPSRSTRPACA